MRKQEELQKECENKKEQVDELENTKNTLNQRIFKQENELMKERETIQNKQHEISKLQEEAVKNDRSAKLFEASKQNLNNTIEDNKALIKKLEEEKAKALLDNETAQVRIDKLDATKHKIEMSLDTKTRDFTLMENLKD